MVKSSTDQCLETRKIWEFADGETRTPGIAHIVIVALFSGIGIVVGTFGSLAVPLGFITHVKFKIRDLLSGIIMMIALYMVHLVCRRESKFTYIWT